MKFKACKHLDFDQSKYSCELVGISNHVGWKRKDCDDRIQLCQMCSKRGRLNNPQACIGENNKVCNDYDEIEFNIE